MNAESTSTQPLDPASEDLALSLERVELFRNLSTAQLRKVLSRFATRLYQPEETIGVLGSQTEELHILVSGQLAVVDEEGMRVATIRPVDTIGELGIITGQRRTASIETVKPSVVLAIGRAEFDAVLREELDIQVKLYENIIRSLCDKIVNENVRQRDAHAASGRHRDEVDELRQSLAAALDLLEEQGFSRDRAERVISSKVHDQLTRRVLVVDDEPIIPPCNLEGTQALRGRGSRQRP